NPSGMFVTFLCAVFEPKSGRLALANAGHCRPVVLPAGKPPRWAVKNLGTALGFEPGLEFELTELTVHDGDVLILYSDGVSEAFNPQEECYGNERLLAESSGLVGQSAPAITASLLQKVRAFAGSAPQSDDIAILTLKVQQEKTELTEKSHSGTPLSPLPPVQLELYATPQEVMRGVETLQQFAHTLRLPEKTIHGLALALEESASNIVNHSLQRDVHKTFHLAMERTDDSFLIELRDSGPEFNPTAVPPRQQQAD